MVLPHRMLPSRMSSGEMLRSERVMADISWFDGWVRFRPTISWASPGRYDHPLMWVIEIDTRQAGAAAFRSR